jgi:hypothetical protein
MGNLRQTNYLDYIVLLRNNLLACTLIFAALECWRPCFFLTDDNLDGAFPFFTELGRSLLAGHSPFISRHLFGGDYNLLRDPTSLAWHPLYLFVSLLAGTPFHNWIIDVDAFVLYLLGAAGFVTLAHYLRREMPLTVSDGWITFYTLSYTFTMIALTTGASWLTFLGNISALPWLALGILQTSWRRGMGLVLIFTLHQFLGGHLAPTVSNKFFLSLFALGVGYSQRSWVPVGNWFIGYTGAVTILLPLLLPILSGFFNSWRSQGVPLSDMQANNIPFKDFPVSTLLGTGLWMMHPRQHLYTTYTLALGSSAAAWCILPALMSRAKWRYLQVVTVAMMLSGMLIIIRPVAISEVMLHLPLLRSMRWPFREFVQFQFFLHLFLLIRPPGLSYVARRTSAVFGTCTFVIPMLLFPLPPTFNSMTWDRELILSGGYESYWAQVRPLLKPTDRIAVLIPWEIYTDDRFEEPYSLLGTFNYAVLANVVNACGYSPTAPRDQLYTKTDAFYPFGAYDPAQKQALMAERPDLKFITLVSLSPLKITLSSHDGPTIDLTPFVPARKSKDLGGDVGD